LKQLRSDCGRKKKYVLTITNSEMAGFENLREAT